MLLKVDDTLKREFMVHMNEELGDFQRTITESMQHVDDTRVLYGCETWTYNKKIRDRLLAFKMYCSRRILCISWTE